MTLDNYSKYLNPQNKILLEEYKRAIQNKMWITTIHCLNLHSIYVRLHAGFWTTDLFV